MKPLLAAALFVFVGLPAAAQDAPVPSQCLAIANAVPNVVYANFTPVQAEAETITITYAGHSTYIIETPGGIRIATDFSGAYGA